MYKRIAIEEETLTSNRLFLMSSNQFQTRMKALNNFLITNGTEYIEMYTKEKYQEELTTNVCSFLKRFEGNSIQDTYTQKTILSKLLNRKKGIKDNLPSDPFINCLWRALDDNYGHRLDIEFTPEDNQAKIIANRILKAIVSEESNYKEEFCVKSIIKELLNYPESQKESLYIAITPD